MTAIITLRHFPSDELTHSKDGLETEHPDRKISSILPCRLEQCLILRLKENRRIALLTEWALNRISRITKDNLVILEELEKSSDCGELTFAGDGRGFTLCQVVYKLDNIKALDSVRDIAVNPPGLEPLDKLPYVPQIGSNGLRRVILPH